MTFKFHLGEQLRCGEPVRVNAPDEPQSVVVAIREIKDFPHYLLAIDAHTWFPERFLTLSGATKS